jgi:hypothetical protein
VVEDFVETLTRGNVTEVKVMLASVALALAFYQVALITVGYGKLRLPFLRPRAASSAHRASGDTIAVILVVVAVMCLSYFGVDENATHAVAGTSLLVVLAAKIAILRRFHHLGRFLPLLGTLVLVLLALTWATSAGDFLADPDE